MDDQQKIEQYLNRVPAFAQPICHKLRSIILQAVPDIIESYKWSSPVYEKNGLVCGIGAFKQYVNLSFFKGATLPDPANLFVGDASRNMRTIKFKDLTEVDEEVLAGYIQRAVSLEFKSITPADKQINIPPDLTEAFTLNPTARSIFEKMAYTHRKEYILWLEDAKKPETRQRRLHKAVEMIAAGQKYS